MKKYILIVMLFPFLLVAQTIDYSKFKGEEVNLSSKVQIDSPYLLSYKIDRDSIIYDVLNVKTVEAVLSRKKKNLFNKDKSGGINFDLKYSFYDEGNLISYIRYREVENKKPLSYELIGFVKKEGVWVELNKNEYRNVRYVFKNLNAEIFWKFYSRKDDSKYPEINKLKPSVKDANGVLNIDMLAKVIKDNKSALAKYLD